MCGINGIVSGSASSGADAVVAEMNKRLEHRGPDEGGTVNLGWGALGMRRLSIVDIEHGHQPMQSSDGRFCIVFNGEIYDYRESRSELLRLGTQFRTNSDTEVLLNIVIQDGIDGLHKLNGMFAFAVADNRDHSITLVRDRVGIKPLFYYLSDDGDLTFSSELGSLVANPAVPRKLDHESLSMFLVDRYVADPYTFFADVRQLEPGSWLKWKGGTIETGYYWRDDLRPDTVADDDSTSSLQTILQKTVESQMVADVPVGVFLSGGIDSSTVAAYASRISGDQLHTFSVGFSDSDHDESAIARMVAQYLGTQHHEIVIEDNGYDQAVLEKVVRHVGQPVGDTSCIPMLYLAEFTANHVKVALSGDGGDEYFGGYNHINWAASVLRASRLPLAFSRSLIAELFRGGSYNPLHHLLGAGRARRIRKGLEYSLLSPNKQLRHIMSLWTPAEVSELLAGGAANFRVSYEPFYTEFKSLPDEEMIMRVLSHTYMPGAILTKVDRMSMAASLEVRVPLLDNRVIDFARSLPSNMKIRNGQGKYVLREAGRNMLPAIIFDHPKQGFSIPLGKWLNSEFWTRIEQMYRPGSDLAALFNPKMLRQTFTDGKSALLNTSNLSSSAAAARIWVLALLGSWFEQFDVEV